MGDTHTRATGTDMTHLGMWRYKRRKEKAVLREQHGRVTKMVTGAGDRPCRQLERRDKCSGTLGTRR